MRLKMTFEQFFSECSKLKSLDFVLLNEPVEIVSRGVHTKYNVIALTISSPRAEHPFAFALAVYRCGGEYRLTILKRYIGWVGEYEDIKTEWVEAHGVFFHPWVKTWFANNPKKLVQAGIMLGLASK